MAKYLIQDILPHDKKHSQKSVGKETTHHHALREESEHVTSPKQKATVSHAVHHNEEPKQEIHDTLEEKPQEMIIENLYHNPTEHAEEAGVEKIEMSGVYPYNTINTIPRDESIPQVRPASSSTVVNFPEHSRFMTRYGSWLPWVLIPTAILTIAVLVFNHYAGATVLLIPKHNTLPLPTGQVFSAFKNPTENQLGYSIMKVTLEDQREVSATGTKIVTAKASGKIVIYNEQTSLQRLIKNTRFESKAGKIYRINDSITIPKAVVKAGKTTPGILTMTIYADEAGPDYNSVPTDFTLPGLKNTPQASKVYARSNGPIAGGASGTVKSVSDQDLKQAGDDIRVSLETKLRTKARGDLAVSQIAYDNGIVVELDEPKLSSQASSGSDKAIVTESGSLYIVVFDRVTLTKAITKQLIPTYAGESVDIKNLEALQFTLPATKGDGLWSTDKLSFSLSGTPLIIWLIDEQKIKKELVDVQKTNFNLILSQYSNIERAKASIQPPWKSAFPATEDAITIKVVDEIPN